MTISSGMRQVLVLGGSWVVVAGALAGTAMYWGEIKSIALNGLARPKAAVAVAAVPEPAARRTRGGEIEIKAGQHGHYSTAIEVNGTRLEVLVDTGASMVALTYEDASQAGLTLRSSDFTQRVQTANGTARFAPVVLDRVQLAHITLTQVTAAVAEPGRLANSLLGMSFLSRLQRVDMRGGVMTLVE